MTDSKSDTVADRPRHLLCLSAATPSALGLLGKKLAATLRHDKSLNLADFARTLNEVKPALAYRRTLIVSSREQAVADLENPAAGQIANSACPSEPRPVAFLFPGQGSEHINMAAELYAAEPGFREVVDTCCDFLEPRLGLDLRQLIYPSEENQTSAAERLGSTALAQPAIFVIEYALARLWMNWGIQPKALIGHSVGEYVGACLAGVFSLEDALTLVAARGRLSGELPPGAMLAVDLPEKEIRALLSDDLALAAINSPTQSVISGSEGAIETLREALVQRQVRCHKLDTRRAFHSPLVKKALSPFRKEVAQVDLHHQKIPFLSNVTGTWIRRREATDVDYWVGQLRKTVRFSLSLDELLADGDVVLLEVGPGQSLTGLVRHHFETKNPLTAMASLPRQGEDISDQDSVLTTLGQLWMAGVEITAKS